MTEQSRLSSLLVGVCSFHPNAPDILFQHGKTRLTSVIFVHPASYRRQRAVDDLGEGARPVEEARWRPIQELKSMYGSSTKKSPSLAWQYKGKNSTVN